MNTLLKAYLLFLFYFFFNMSHKSEPNWQDCVGSVGGSDHLNFLYLWPGIDVYMGSVHFLKNIL